MTDSRAIPVSDYAKDEIARMHRELTDDDFIAEHMRRTAVKNNIADKIADTGL